MNQNIRLIGISLLVFISVGIFSGCGSSSSEGIISMNTLISKDSKFTYKTSITDSVSNEKAEVYSTQESVNSAVETVKGIKIPEESKVLTEGKAVLLSYQGEEVFVYEGTEQNSDKPITYVQVAPEPYLENRGYRGTYRPGGFFHTYGMIRAIDDVSSGFRKSRYNSRGSSKVKFSNSIKNSSSGSRKSSGGGTSFGK